ncbi:MAG: DUF1801 domain-containing protein [Caldilineaceae bacterium]|nr:DUF1801 domain-containing protein [Caldilineaceae bacterium]
MAELKTQRNDQDVEAFLNALPDDQRRQDCFSVLEIMREVTGAEPKMWGDSIVGFGDYRYRYESGRQGEWFLTGFSPRKQNLTLYMMAGFDHYDELMGQLGKFKTGKSCLYIKKLRDINVPVLRELVKQSVAHMIETNP